MDFMNIDKFSKLKRWLLDSNCEFVRNGKGTHQIWRTKDGRKICIPHHNIYKRNTLRQIIKQVEGTWNYR
ncbi:type II toxin-antitoxin system HicA family toxin [Mycoplasmatota bacterium zrk1]